MAKKAALSNIVISADTVELLDEAIHLDRREQGIRKGPPASAIIAAATRAEDGLARAGVAVSNRAGCEYEYREAGPWAKSYDNTKKAVAFTLRRTARGWVVVKAGNDIVYPRQPEIDRLVLTPKAKEAVVRVALAPFRVMPEKVAA